MRAPRCFTRDVLGPRAPARRGHLREIVERKPAHVFAFVAHGERSVQRGHGGEYDVPVGGAREAAVQVVSIQIDDLRRQQRQVGDAGLLAGLPLRGQRDGRIRMLEVPPELQPELALAMEAQQDLIER